MAEDGRRSRRRFLAATVGVGATALAGCSMVPGFGNDSSVSIPSLSEFRGSGALVEGRPAPGGTSIEDLPNLNGTLVLYLGGGEGGIYEQFIDELEKIYPNFNVESTRESSSNLANTIIEEGKQSPADLFWSIDAGSLAAVANAGAYTSLPDNAVAEVPDSFVGDDNAWVGVAGRARSIPYNTNQLSEDDIPNKIADFTEAPALSPTGWAPTYGAFKSFVTAMRVLSGDDDTREWLESMQAQGVERYPNEQVASSSVADGAVPAAFANHYYSMRVKNSRPDAPLDLAFTEGDAGALVNVAGALAIQGTNKDTLISRFVRHLLSAEAQEFFATTSYSYPMIPGVEPVGELPTVDELSPPEMDLAELSDIEPTLDLMRDAGVL